MGSPREIRIFRDLLKSRNPDFVYLSETLVDAKVMKDLAAQVGFDNSFDFDRVGRGGGFAIMWKNSVNCKVINHSNYYIDVNMMDGMNISWRLTCYYGYPERERRQAAWDMLRSLANNNNVPWCIFGDFNDLLYVSDKQGIRPHPQNLLDGFRLAIEECGLTEIDLTGGEFTWEKCKGKVNWVREKLDRGFAND